MKSEDDFYAQVGQSIQRIREERGLTQEALGALVSLTRTSITNIEKGRQRFLVHTFVAFAEALNVAITDLLPESDEPETPLDEALLGLEDNVQGWIRAAVDPVKSKP